MKLFEEITMENLQALDDARRLFTSVCIICCAAGFSSIFFLAAELRNSRKLECSVLSRRLNLYAAAKRVEASCIHAFSQASSVFFE